MPGKDKISNRKALYGNNRSHALNSTRRRYDLNLQKVTMNEDGKKVKVRVSVKTVRTLKKQGKLA